jgi:hypothetical protein
MCDEQKVTVEQVRNETTGEFRVSGLDAELRSLALLEDLKTYVESQYLPMCEHMTSFDVQEFFFPSLVKVKKIVPLDDEDSDEAEISSED